jgi:inosine-uridine nucleoside N-ribohydrolase
MDAVYVHDPCALAAVLQPSLFSWQAGQVKKGSAAASSATGVVHQDMHQSPACCAGEGAD